ncbi:MAG: DUF222 domain-containing protein, partial [Geodermatophilaceae bacterium]|nr:DUF222 domain-containing protein [Geodermatophilaceae bacterium]
VTALPAEVSVDAVGPDGEPDPHGVPVPVRVVGEAHLLAAADQHDAGQLDRLGRHLLAVIAPEIGEAAEAEALRRQEERDRERRELSWSQDRHGGMRFSGHLDPEGAQMLRAALDPLSAPHPVDGHRDERTAGRRRGDALVEVCRRTLEHGTCPPKAGNPRRSSSTSRCTR